MDEEDVDNVAGLRKAGSWPGLLAAALGYRAAGVET
jgi:hypothetical protein